MKIGIDISQVVYKGTGVARFTNNLIQAIANYDNKNQWFFFFSSLRRNLDQKLRDIVKNKGYQLKQYKYPPSFLSFWWNNLHKLPSKFLTFNFSFLTELDWFISSDWSEPPLKNVNKTTVVHDLVYLRHPETVANSIVKNQRKRLAWVKKESKVIFADSQATKKDLIELLAIEKNRIIVNYPGVEVLKPTPAEIKQTLKKYHLTKPFILTVGKLEPRKNLARLIEAIKQYNNQTIDLVIVGPGGWGRQLDSDAMKQPNIRLLGYVNDSELYCLYSSCLFFIYPSIWEGFGYPVVEAMKIGAPVSCSNTSSIKEITDNAALLFDPYDLNNMTQCISELSRNETLRKHLTQKGLERSKLFTWQKYYDKLIKTLERYYK